MAGSRLDMLKQIATGLAAQFGDNCEVVVHDLARNVAESSIVHIENGHITGRKVATGRPARCSMQSAIRTDRLPTDYPT